MPNVSVALDSKLFKDVDDKVHEEQKKNRDISKASVGRALYKLWVDGKVEVKV